MMAGRKGHGRFAFELSCHREDAKVAHGDIVFMARCET